jgi:RNA polymerase sigma-70 factor (ECF subfamily)
MLRHGSEAEDVSQEVFLRIHRSFGTYDPTRTLAPWVARTTYNACLRRLEGSARKTTQDSGNAELGAIRDAGAPNPEQTAAATELQDLLARALGELPAQDRALLDLRYQEGLSDAEVSEATGMPVNTVKTRIYRARGRLRSWLAPLLSED